MNDEERPLTVSVDKAARLIDVSRRTMERWVSEGTIPSVLIGGRRLIRFRDLESAVEKGRALNR